MFSSDSLIVGSRPSCREGVPFVEVFQISFLKWISSNAECSEIGLSNGELAVARIHLTRVSGWWCQIVVRLLPAVVEILR